MGRNTKIPFGNEERYRAGKAQMKVFRTNQYLYWRVAVVKSIRKIILNSEDFYRKLEDEFLFDVDANLPMDEHPDIVNNQIRNGWMFEAVSQAEQAIEDLFSLLKNSGDIAYFAKNVVNYSASQVKKYIWNFKTDDIKYIMQEFGLPYFPLKEPWDNQEVFEFYKESVLLMQSYLQDLIAFHKKYYLDYCQYKHGMSVALCPFGKMHKKGEHRPDPHIGGLMTFDSYTVEKRSKASGELPHLALYATPEIGPYVSRLHAEGNLLHYSMKVVNIADIVQITEKAFTLLNIVWCNLMRRCEVTDEDNINEWAFPEEDYHQYVVIGFPVDHSQQNQMPSI